MSFGRKLEEFRVEAKDTSEKVVRASLLDLFSAIILSTPVDKGVLRNGWNVTFDKPSDQVPTRGAPVGSATINRAKLELDTLYNYQTPTVFLTNNLPYAHRIEFEGYSAQAPAGMVRINTARWNQIIEANARKFK